MWYLARVRADLFIAIRKEFPNRVLPYSYKEMLEIGRCVNVEDNLDLWWLRTTLRELAYDTWRYLQNQGTVNKSTRRDAIHKGIVKPIDELLPAFKTLRKIGAEEAFALARDDCHGVNVEQLVAELEDLKSWAKAAQEKVMDGSVPKGKTAAKQEFVDRLYSIYQVASDRTPTRNVGKDGKRHYEDGDFSNFVTLCAAPVFPKAETFSNQIRKSIRDELSRLTTGQKDREIDDDFIQSISSKIQRS